MGANLPERRILFVCHDAARTGAPIVLLALMRWLRRNTPLQLGVIVRRDGPLLPEFQALGPTLLLKSTPGLAGRLARRIQRYFPIESWREQRAIQKFLRGHRYDLIYSNTITNGEMVDRLTYLRLPVITHVHELEHWIRRAGEENLEKVKRQTTRYIAAANAVKQNLVENHGTPAEAIDVVHEFVDEPPGVPSAEEKREARRRLGLPDRAFVVGASGAEFWRKGRDLVVHLLLALRRRAPGLSVHLVWVGRPGAEEEEYELRADLVRSGVEAMFHATGEVPHPHLFFSAFDVFALPSRDDPFPLVCLEAASMGLPIICFSGAGGMPELVEDDCGFVVPYLDLDLMAQKIIEIHERPELRAELGRRGREKVTQRHLATAAAPQIHAIVEEVGWPGQAISPLRHSPAAIN